MFRWRTFENLWEGWGWWALTLLIIFGKSSCSVTQVDSPIFTWNFLALQQTHSDLVGIHTHLWHLQKSVNSVIWSTKQCDKETKPNLYLPSISGSFASISLKSICSPEAIGSSLKDKERENALFGIVFQNMTFERNIQLQYDLLVGEGCSSLKIYSFTDSSWVQLGP